MFFEVRQRHQSTTLNHKLKHDQSPFLIIPADLEKACDEKFRLRKGRSKYFSTFWLTLVSHWQPQQQQQQQKRRLRHHPYDNRRMERYRIQILFLFAVGCFVVVVCQRCLTKTHRRNLRNVRYGRPVTNWELDRLAVLLRYDAEKISRISLPMMHVLPQKEQQQQQYHDPDYGELVLNWLPESSFVRRIPPNEEHVYNVIRSGMLETMNAIFMETQYYHNDELEDELTSECRRNNWQENVYPNCNEFHTTALERPLIGWNGRDEESTDIQYLGQGYFRAVWLLESPVLGSSVLKRIRLHDDFPLDVKDFHKIQRDAIIMERLTSSPRIVNIYGHCGTSLMSETMKGEITSEMMYQKGYMNPKDLHDAADEVRPLNNYTVAEKLQVALEMAESIADLHGYEGGVIIHGDVHPVQWLRAADGTLKLNDFNNAEILEWDGQQYCKWWRWFGGMYRSPEEFRGDSVDEKMDVFSMGNNFYVLLTGLLPFYHINSYAEVQARVINGTRPFVDERYRKRSFGEFSMIHIMEQCWEYDPKKRPDIFQVVRFLRKVIQENEIAINVPYTSS